MIEIYRTNADGTIYYENNNGNSKVTILISHIVHIRDYTDVREIRIQAGNTIDRYYTTDSFKKIKDAIEKQLSRGVGR
tara:strand:- start:822 stop:1055 length:234 start_codon:yes stop_codon:yes gene_type:complete